MTMKQWFLSSLVASTCLMPMMANAGPIENYSPVTPERLKNPEPGNWMLYRRTYDGQGYSPLDQINASNVKNLVPVWTFSTGVIEGHEAPPIINNGVMFVANLVAHIMVPMLYSATFVFAPMPWAPNAASSCAVAGIMNLRSVDWSENSPCRSRKSAPGICAVSNVCCPGTTR